MSRSISLGVSWISPGEHKNLSEGLQKQGEMKWMRLGVFRVLLPIPPLSSWEFPKSKGWIQTCRHLHPFPSTCKQGSLNRAAWGCLGSSWHGHSHELSPRGLCPQSHPGGKSGTTRNQSWLLRQYTPCSKQQPVCNLGTHPELPCSPADFQ